MEFPDNICNPIIYSAAAVSTLYSGYLFVRPWIRINVECWFCMAKHRVRYPQRNSWHCPDCQQYNGFNVDGSYNRYMSEHYHLNSNRFCRNSARNNRNIRYEHYRLCNDCNELEAIKIRMISEFVPVDDGRFNDELFQYRRNLDQMYPICEECQQLIRKLIDDDDSLPNRIPLSKPPSSSSLLLPKNQLFGNRLKSFAYFLLNLATIFVLSILFCLNLQEEPFSGIDESLPNLLSQKNNLGINYLDHYLYLVCVGFLLYFPLLQIEPQHQSSSSNHHTIVVVTFDICQLFLWLLLATNHPHHHYYHLLLLDQFEIIRLQRFIIPLLIGTYLVRYFYFAILKYFNSTTVAFVDQTKTPQKINEKSQTPHKYTKDERLIRKQIKDLSISPMNNDFDLYSLGNSINNNNNDQSPFMRISKPKTNFANCSFFSNHNLVATTTTTKMNYDDNYWSKSNTAKTTTTMMNSPRILNYYIKYENRPIGNDNCCNDHHQQQQSMMINKQSNDNSLCLQITTTFTLILTLTILMLMIVLLSLPSTGTIQIDYQHDHFNVKFFYPNYTTIM